MLVIRRCVCVYVTRYRSIDVLVLNYLQRFIAC